MNKKKVL